MRKRFLITTALEETWCDNTSVLFLGEWCRLYSRKKKWLSINGEVLSYHWDNREKLFADYQYLQEFYETLLNDLTVRLNKIHGVDHSLRYWRILMGPWLNYFVSMVFDRWESVMQAMNAYQLSETIVLKGNEEILVPQNMSDFNSLYVEDAWNHFIYSYILTNYTSINYLKQQANESVGKRREMPSLSWKRKFQRILAEMYMRVAARFSSKEDLFFLSTYLPYLDEMRLNRRLGQVPILWRSFDPVLSKVDYSQRQWSIEEKGGTAFEACVRALIPQQIPIAYLEGYHKLLSQINKLPWPQKPKLIWTSNSYSSDDVFKLWAAEKVDHGSTLVIGQHGGHYGVGRWSSSQEHEIAISDCYLTWGWKESKQSKVKALAQLKSKGPLGVYHAEQPEALLVSGIFPRQSYRMYSAVVSKQWLDYFEGQCCFVTSLPSHIRKALTIRLHHNDYGWGQKNRWLDRFPDIRLDNGESNINDLMKRSRLYISTYNATTYLESFTMNVPTVIFWDPYYWELSDDAKPYFQSLMDVGIFHDNPKSASLHIETIWDDVESWWLSPSVQKTIEKFKQKYCRLSNDLLGEVEPFLRDVVDRSARPLKN